MVNSAQSIDGHSKAKVARLLAIKMTYEDESEGNLERCANCAVLEAEMQQLRLVLSDATAKKNTLPNSNNKSSQTVGTTLTDISTR